MAQYSVHKPGQLNILAGGKQVVITTVSQACHLLVAKDKRIIPLGLLKQRLQLSLTKYLYYTDAASPYYYTAVTPRGVANKRVLLT